MEIFSPNLVRLADLQRSMQILGSSFLHRFSQKTKRNGVWYVDAYEALDYIVYRSRIPHRLRAKAEDELVAAMKAAGIRLPDTYPATEAVQPSFLHPEAVQPSFLHPEAVQPSFRHPEAVQPATEAVQPASEAVQPCNLQSLIQQLRSLQFRVETLEALQTIGE